MIFKLLFLLIWIIFCIYSFRNERKQRKEYQKLIDERLKSNKEFSDAIKRLNEVIKEIEKEYKKTKRS
ncbi:hypothetical protein P7H75_13975 [Vagococcus carniphilus]|uniref:hypothetical protein n=1 Tax=Vagococcus carniphilus TaxID=218144 RepID=UPI00288F7A93|nr:hypothetical protein [Vagococcus carniphilus]MDT2815963.1 hypothetical protein [Vagococcus carniphilus]